MAFTTKSWQNGSGGGTPLNAASLIDLETRLSGYTDTASGLLIPKSIVTAKGDIITASASGTPTRQAIGSDDQVPTADSTQTNGWKWATPPGKSLSVTTATRSSNSAAIVASFTIPSNSLVAGSIYEYRIYMSSTTAGGNYVTEELDLYIGTSGTSGDSVGYAGAISCLSGTLLTYVGIFKVISTGSSGTVTTSSGAFAYGSGATGRPFVPTTTSGPISTVINTTVTNYLSVNSYGSVSGANQNVLSASLVKLI